MTGTGLDRLADHWWTLAAAGYDPAVGLVGWHRRLDDLVADVGSGRLLDVGCGPAYLATGLGARGVAYTGVDRNPTMLSRAAHRVASPRSALVRADVTALPFRDGSFDVVVAAGLLGLLDVPMRRSALREIARVAAGEVRLLEPVHRPGEPARSLRSHVVGLVRQRPLELAELVGAGLEPEVIGPAVLGRVYSVVRARSR